MSLRGARKPRRVGAELKRLRQERNWSLRTLGARTHIDFSFLSRIENGGRRASVSVIEKLDAELGAGGTLIAAWVAENRITRPAQLPAAPVRFVGRNAQLAKLADILSGQAGGPPAVVTLHGPAGAGKTALALRCAHDLANRFFDGQLYCDLGGFAASRADNADPAAVLAWFCIALGADPTAIPVATRERTALYRSLLADRRVLIVLDNAAHSRHVEHLLPGAGHCAVIVTSRRILSGLTALVDAYRVLVGPLPQTEAVALLTTLVGPERASREPDAIVALAGLCDHLPLPLRLAAEHVISHPDQPIHALVGDLRPVGSRLDHLDHGDAPGMRSVISWSYAQLSTATARTFRLLGVIGGSMVDIDAVAAVAGIDLTSARGRVRDLGRLHLVEVSPNNTFHLSELVHAYAQERLLAEDGPAERAAALERLIAYQNHRKEFPDGTRGHGHDPAYFVRMD
jgi:transcriptional regulator with XRE-family HTH domain